MKTIYLCENESDLRRVYGTDAKIYCKADVLQSPEAFRET